MRGGIWEKLLPFWKGAVQSTTEASSQASQTQVAPARAGHKRSPVSSPRDLVNLGLDFGTSSTKIFWRDILRNKPGLLVPREQTNGYSRYCVPSTLKVAEGRLLLGHRAESHSGPGQVFRSLKVCLACSLGAIECRGCANSLVGSGQPSGRFGVNLLAGRILEAGAAELCSLLLAGLIRESRELVHHESPGGKETDFTVNISAPLDQIEYAKQKGAFEGVIHAAWELSHSVEIGMPFEDAHQLYADCAQSAPPPEGERAWTVFPEAVAGIHAFCQSPMADDGLYALIDVGAGATSVSFFRFTRNLRPPLAFYASHTAAIGGDDLDRAMVRTIERKYGHPLDSQTVLHSVRLAKARMEALGALQLEDGRELDLTETNEALEPVLSIVFQAYVEAFRRAYKKESLESRWEQLNVVLSGGGTLVPQVRARLGQRPWERVIDLRCLPMRLEGPGNKVDLPSKMSPADQMLLLVSFGLSFPSADIPDYWKPIEVDPIGPKPTKAPDPPDWW